MDHELRKPWKAAFYRQCRLWHGYLSAVAFLWLLFFSITGILLNHPAWLAAPAPAAAQTPFQLSPSELIALRGDKERGTAAVALLRERLGLRGDVTSTDLLGNLLFVRLRGARGSSDLQLDLQSGRGSASTEAFSSVALLKELHRGEQEGPEWRALIDISGFLLAATALLGLLIYFSLRFRLRTAVILIGLGGAAMLGGIMLFVR